MNRKRGGRCCGTLRAPVLGESADKLRQPIVTGYPATCKFLGEEASFTCIPASRDAQPNRQNFSG